MSLPSFQITGNLVDPLAGRISPATVEVDSGRIARIVHGRGESPEYLLPGFVDAHVHIESSMLLPSRFAAAAVVHGTVATVSDPHEIANVLGAEGVRFMLEDAAGSPLKISFGAPSCVPATDFETAGDRIDSAQVARLLDDPRIGYLSEMMNFPGVLSGDWEVMAKLRAAVERGKPIDGHAPGLRGDAARRYIAAGITTDHECVALDEAEEKIACGAKVAIREGSAARNFAALSPLITTHRDMCFLCSDDKHPDELAAGHIDQLVRRAIAEGAAPLDVLRVACVNPVLHYGLDVGLLREGDPADFIVVDNLREMRVRKTYIGGRLVAESGTSLFELPPTSAPNRFLAEPRAVGDFRMEAVSSRLHAIRALDGQLMTECEVLEPSVRAGSAVADPARDLLKIAVVNRYQAHAPAAVAFVRGFGLRRGALASSVAHDCHNVVAVGADDEDLCAAINLVIAARGGLAAACGSERHVLPLPVAGLMATGSCGEVGKAYAELDRFAKNLGSQLRAPFMTLSFMALLVIPAIKLSDRGLFDGNRFEFMPLFT